MVRELVREIIAVMGTLTGFFASNRLGPQHADAEALVERGITEVHRTRFSLSFLNQAPGSLEMAFLA